MNPPLSNYQILSSYPPDILFSIAKELSYQDILKLCKVSKRFNDLFCIKNYNNLWRYLYLRDISSTSLPLGTNYYNLYLNIQKEIRGLPPNNLLYYASQNGYIHLVQKSLEDGADNYNLGLIKASEEGHMDIVKLMLNLGANDYNWALEHAASHGHLNIVKLMLDLGATDYDRALISAANGGQMDIVKLMLSLGATDYNSGLAWASYRGHIDIVKLMLDLGATNYSSAIGDASYAGHFNVVEYIKKYRDLHT